MEERLKVVFSSYDGKEEELIPILQQVQEEFGYLPEQATSEIAKFTGAPESRVYSVATFYTQFRFTPIGRNHVMVCRGTACHVRGAPRILEELENQLGIKEGETTPDMAFSRLPARRETRIQNTRCRLPSRRGSRNPPPPKPHRILQRSFLGVQTAQSPSASAHRLQL